MAKYRYMMSGSFTPEEYEYIYEGTDHRTLCIEIPSPYSRETEDEAKRDGTLSYRFVSVEGEVLIAVYPGENFELDKDSNGRKCLKTWLKGHPFYFYNYNEFKALGGMIYEMPESMICSIPEDISEDEIIARLEEWKNDTKEISWNTGDYESKITFNELFPSLTPEDNPVYIDDEAYCIVKEQ